MIVEGFPQHRRRQRRWSIPSVAVTGYLVACVVVFFASSSGVSALSSSGLPAASAAICLGGGCFWCTEPIFKKVDGVIQTKVGYAGGNVPNPTYKQVCSGQTGHAECCRIEYDSEAVRLEDLLDLFWMTHDPTQGNRQGLDVGSHYRSIILFEDEKEQREICEESIRKQQEKLRGGLLGSIWPSGRSITTELKELQDFWPAANVHQDFYNKNRAYPYCMMWIDPKVRKVGGRIAQLNNNQA